MVSLAVLPAHTFCVVLPPVSVKPFNNHIAMLCIQAFTIQAATDSQSLSPFINTLQPDSMEQKSGWAGALALQAATGDSIVERWSSGRRI